MSSASWVPLGSHFFQQTHVFASGSRWDADLDLSSSLVARAPFAGPVAVTRDSTQLHGLDSPLNDDVVIFTCAGELLARIPRDDASGNLIFLGWSGRELLYCVYESGVVDV
jgi:hypothetical protein